MRCNMLPIQVYAWTEADGTIHPVRISTATRKAPLRVEKVIERAVDKLAGRPVQVFSCQNGERRYELQYHPTNGTWFLSKW